MKFCFRNISSIDRSNMERSFKAQEAPAMARDNAFYLSLTRVVRRVYIQQQIAIARYIVASLQCH